MMKLLKFALFVGIVLIGYSMWKFQNSYERVIGAYGVVQAKSETGNEELTARTRAVTQGPVSFQEVELPSGSWIDCGGDCSDKLRREAIDIVESELDN